MAEEGELGNQPATLSLNLSPITCELRGLEQVILPLQVSLSLSVKWEQ